MSKASEARIPSLPKPRLRKIDHQALREEARRIPFIKELGAMPEAEVLVEAYITGAQIARGWEGDMAKKWPPKKKDPVPGQVVEKPVQEVAQPGPKIPCDPGCTLDHEHVQ